MRTLTIALLTILAHCSAPYTDKDGKVDYSYKFLVNFDKTTDLQRTAITNTIEQINLRLGCQKLSVEYRTRKSHDEWVNDISFIDFIRNDEEGISVAGQTYSWVEYDGKMISSIVVRFIPNPTDANFVKNIEKYGIIITHEIGHTFGLVHTPDDLDNVMYLRERYYDEKFNLFPEDIWTKFIADLSNKGITCNAN